jgi:hypothetical protein
MPYEIKRYKTGFRVYAQNGRPLSKAALSFGRAQKQFTAVNIAHAQKKGGSVHTAQDEQEDVEIRSYPLSDGDIEDLLPGIKVLSYPDFNSMTSIEQAFDKEGRCLFLYLTEDENTGHWCCMINHKNHIEYFDPYGGIGPDGESKWLSKSKLEELDQDTKQLSKLLRASGKPVKSNPHKFQKHHDDVATCGRHCVVRLHFSNLSLPQYSKMIKESGMTADDFVSAFTYRFLKK